MSLLLMTMVMHVDERIRKRCMKSWSKKNATSTVLMEEFVLFRNVAQYCKDQEVSIDLRKLLK